MAHSFTNLLYHIVFATKDRRPWLDDSIRGRVHEFLGGGIREEGFGTSLIVGGVSDHVHILARLRQTCAVSEVLKTIKGNSSGWISKTFPTHVDFEWQPGYAAFSVSESQVIRVRKYIAEQEEHHRTMTFRDELIHLLNGNNIQFDLRDLFA